MGSSMAYSLISTITSVYKVVKTGFQASLLFLLLTVCLIEIETKKKQNFLNTL